MNIYIYIYIYIFFFFFFGIKQTNLQNSDMHVEL